MLQSRAAVVVVVVLVLVVLVLVVTSNIAACFLIILTSIAIHVCIRAELASKRSVPCGVWTDVVQGHSSSKGFHPRR